MCVFILVKMRIASELPLSIFVSLYLAAPGCCQATSGPPLSFIGGGVGLGPRDIESRVAHPANQENFEGTPIGDAGRLFTWHLDGAWRVAPRAALGAEFMVLEPAHGVLRGGGYAFTELQEERLLTALARFRLTTSPRAAVDIVGGPGLLFWRRTDQATFFGFNPPRSTETREQSSVDLALAAGLDAQFAVARHVSLVVGGRLLWLGRETLTEFDDPQEPSARVLVTVGIRAGR